MKTNHPPRKAIEDVVLSNSLEDNPYVQWAIQNGRNIVWGLLALIALLILGYKISFGGSIKAEKEFFQAENDYILFQNSITQNKGKEDINEALSKLETQLDRFQELHAKYDGPIAQALLSQGETEQAKAFAESTLARTMSENKPFYNDYAQTTFLISDQNYTEALKQALLLKEKMLENIQRPEQKAFGDILFAYNLLRIAMLQQQLNAREDELKTWQEWQQYAQGINSEVIKPKAFEEVSTQFSLKDISLKDYIQSRQKGLEIN